MYQKVFRASGGSLPSLPMLVVAEHDRSDIIIGLRGLGWARFGELVSNAPGSVEIRPHDVEIMVGGVSLLRRRDGHAGAPAGWYEAVASLSQRCLVVVVRAEQFSAPEDLEDALELLIGTDSAACALIPVSVTSQP